MPETITPNREELEARRQQLAPEVLDNDPAAIAELDQIDEAIRRLELGELAEREQTARLRAAELAEAQRVRDAAARKQARLEAKRNGLLGDVEAALQKLIDAAQPLWALELEIEQAGRAAHGADYHRLRTRELVGERVGARLWRELHIEAGQPVTGRLGAEPLGG